MRPANYLPKPTLLLAGLAGLSLYGVHVDAQETTSASEDDKADSKTDDAKSDAAAPTTTADDKSSEEAKPTETTKDEPTTTAKKDEKTTEEAETTEEEETKTTEEAKSTKAKTTEAKTTEEPSTETETEAPTSTTDIKSSISAVTSATESMLTDLPTLTRNPAIPTYPAPAVPPTKNAPFMQHSSAPDGTVFIAVGAILGAFGLGILIWRAVVGFLLHRSVERAARAQHEENAKAGFPPPPAPFYNYNEHNSTMSLGGAGAGGGAPVAAAPVAAGRGVRRTTRGPTPSSNPSQSNLFFSPTAATNSNPAGGNRSSAFLPSGFYAAGNSSPAGTNHDHSVSATNLRPDSRGYFGNASRYSLNPSPPETPPVNPRRDISSSSLNLNRPPSQRTPSAFLDDLLTDDPNILPPPHMPPAFNRHSSYGNGASPGPQNRF